MSVVPLPRLFWQSMWGRLLVGGTSLRKGSEVSEEKKDDEEGRKASLVLVVSSVRYCRRVRIVPGRLGKNSLLGKVSRLHENSEVL